VRDFEFLTPTTASDASRMLADHGETARLLAGGTALLLVMRARLASPSHLVWLGEVPGLDRVALDARDGLTLGAMATHHAVETHAGIRAAYPMLAEMARRVANPHVRNAGTLGGNLCYGDPASDPPTCLLALDAEVRAVRGAQERAISLDGFFTDYYENALAPDEVLTEVRIPPMPPGAVGVYHRFTTTPAESRPLVGVGVVLVAGRDRVCRRARVALGAVTAVPRRLRAVEDFLTGKPLDGATLARAGALAVEGLEPLSDFRASADYRTRVVQVLVRRALAEAGARAAAA